MTGSILSDTSLLSSALQQASQSSVVDQEITSSQVPKTLRTTSLQTGGSSSTTLSVTSLIHEIPVTSPIHEIPVTSLITEMPNTSLIPGIPVTSLIPEIPVTSLTHEMPVTSLIPEIAMQHVSLPGPLPMFLGATTEFNIDPTHISPLGPIDVDSPLMLTISKLEKSNKSSVSIPDSPAIGIDDVSTSLESISYE